VTTPEHPQGNSVCERVNGTISRILTRLCLQHEQEWDVLLSQALCAYRTSVQKTLNMTPAEVLYGRKLITVSDVIVPHS